MVTTELGACEWFVWDLRRSNLIERGQLDQVVGEFLQKNPRAEPPALADYLVQRGLLSSFQSDRLLQGKTQGFVLGPYTLMDAVGTGSMGTVYKALSKTDNNWYAVKVLPRRSMWNVRIARRKVRAFEQCRHPAVVPFVDVGTAGGMHYLAWPFVEGLPFEKLVQEQGRLHPAEAAYYAMQVAEALDVCHQQGLFHGLVKPSNLMVGGDQQVFVLDFGIGCLLAETEGESLVDTMSISNSVTAGLECASPESIMDPTKLTPAGDQYSLGCVLYYALTGQFPFPGGKAAEKMMAHQFKEPQPISELNPDVPSELIAVVERLMKKAPEARYGTAAEVVEALRPLAAGARVAARPAVRPQPRVEAAPRTAAAVPPAPRPRRAEEPAAPAARPQAPAAKTPRPVAPSAPTPRPQAIGSLPSRSSLRGAATPPPVPPAPEPDVDESVEREVPGAVTDGYYDDSSLEERLGPLGLTLGAIAACAIVWLLAAYLRLF